MENKSTIKKIIVLSIISLFLGYIASTVFFTAFPQNPNTYNYFTKISEMPYGYTPEVTTPETFWKNGYGDCNDRAMAFKSYLITKGATDVQICLVFRIDEKGQFIPSFYKDKSPGHSFVVWNKKVYSPNLNESNRVYAMDIGEYQKFLKETYGFNIWYYENQTVGTPF
ncbi:MAG: hypothetical protein HZC47_01660 [Methanobacterium sp.]|uniref:hypothetical protein n=1 Tax=Methanobacterium sp. TaxID=2164 RepID=UPI003D6512A9|nr:hypothetical protein [Methanobacterium sp.]